MSDSFDNQELFEPGQDNNPYAPGMVLPTASLVEESDVEKIRRDYLRHEKSIKSIGGLYAIGGVIAICFGVTVVASDLGSNAVSILLPFLLVGCVLIGIGVGVRKLTPWGRYSGAVVSALGLFSIPIGTIIHSYFLYLLISQRGAYVCSPEYKKIIEQTPNVKLKTSPLIWGLLAFVLFLLGGMALSMVFG